MSKRKRSTSSKNPDGTDAASTSPQEAQESTGPEAPEAETQESEAHDMAHVSPDILASSPDIFAAKRAAPEVAEPAAPAPDEPPEVTSEPMETEAVNLETPAESVTETEPTESASALAPAETAAAPPPPPRPPASSFVATAPPARRGATNSTIALGVVLVVVGIFALGVVLFGVDLTQYGWPLFVIIPGLTLLIVGFFGLGSGASIPGGLLTMLGLVLAYQSASGDWASWAFAWALVAPGGVGLGMYLQALKDRDMAALRRGRTLIFIALILFMVGFVFFESILGISGTDYGVFGKAALPLLLIAGGVILLVRNTQRSRKA